MSEQWNFIKMSEQTIADGQLQETLRKAITHSREKRQDIVAEYENWEDMRTKAGNIKERVLTEHHDLLAQFKQSATSQEVTVLEASDALQACSLIEEICLNHNVKSIVKSKSMMTEEVKLNAFLQSQGFSVRETDLGEFIAQVADISPSHITAPVIHLNRKQIGRIIADFLKKPHTESAEEITAHARVFLRNAFLTADCGITGANFALAQEGAVVIVENEGNIRLTIGSPKVHIAIIGIERLIPSINELPLFLRLLVGSATGQKMTNYMSIIRGGATQDESDGPKYLYYILVDNGRKRLLKNKKFSTILKCIRCGACMNACPVYQQVGGHCYGAIYPGPMGAVLNPLLFSFEKFAQLPFASTLCGACSEVCPVKIPLHKLLLDLRAEAVSKRKRSSLERVAFAVWRLTMTHPGIYQKMLAFIRITQKVLPQRLFRKGLPHLKWPPVLPRIADHSVLHAPLQTWSVKQKSDPPMLVESIHRQDHSASQEDSLGRESPLAPIDFNEEAIPSVTEKQNHLSVVANTVEQFIAQSRANSNKCELFTSLPALQKQLFKDIQLKQCRKLVYFDSPDFDVQALFDEPDDFTRPVGDTSFISASTLGHSSAEIKNSLSTFDASLIVPLALCAESGGFIEYSNHSPGRLGSILPPNLFVIAKTSMIYGTWEELVTVMVNEWKSSSGSAFFYSGGPSRTADIEKIIVYGVHGPISVHLYLLDT